MVRVAHVEDAVVSVDIGLVSPHSDHLSSIVRVLQSQGHKLKVIHSLAVLLGQGHLYMDLAVLGRYVDNILRGLQVTGGVGSHYFLGHCLDSHFSSHH